MKHLTLTEAITCCRRLLLNVDDPGNVLEGLLDSQTRDALNALLDHASTGNMAPDASHAGTTTAIRD